MPIKIRVCWAVSTDPTEGWWALVESDYDSLSRSMHVSSLLEVILQDFGNVPPNTEKQIHLLLRLAGNKASLLATAFMHLQFWATWMSWISMTSCYQLWQTHTHKVKLEKNQSGTIRRQQSSLPLLLQCTCCHLHLHKSGSNWFTMVYAS